MKIAATFCAGVCRLFLRVSLEGLGDLSTLFVPFVEQQTVTEGHGLAGRKNIIPFVLFPVLAFEVVQTERIGGKQAVIADVPIGRVAKTAGMIEHGDADHFAVEQAVVIDPRSRLAPGGVVTLAVGVDDVAPCFLPSVCLRSSTEGMRTPMRSFFGVAELHRTIAGFDRDVEIDRPHIAVTAKCQRAHVFALLLASRVDPVIDGADHGLLAIGLALEIFAMDLLGAARLGPEVNAIDAAVRKPERAMMQVVFPSRPLASSASETPASFPSRSVR